MLANSLMPFAFARGGILAGVFTVIGFAAAVAPPDDRAGLLEKPARALAAQWAMTCRPMARYWPQHWPHSDDASRQSGAYAHGVVG
jgi:hypothetical protein